MSTNDSHNTVGTIAQKLGVPLHRVAYVIKSRCIKPVARAGHAWIYSNQQVDQIDRYIRAIDGFRNRSLNEQGDDNG